MQGWSGSGTQKNANSKNSKNYGKFAVKAANLLMKLETQQQTLLQPSTAQENATLASYRISNIIVRSGHAFAAGDFVKECLTVAAEAVCPTQKRYFLK